MLGEKHSDSLRLNAWVSCDINKGMHAFSQTSKQLVGQPFTRESPAYAVTRLAGSQQSPKLQTWGSLMVQTFFFNKLMKIAAY